MVLKYIPDRFKLKWLLVFLLTSILCVIVLSLGLLVAALMGATLHDNLVIVYVFVLFFNIFICIVGFFGAKHYFVINELALYASGFIALLNAATDLAGWEFFLSTIILVIFISASTVIGLITQLIVRFRNEKTTPTTLKYSLWVLYIVLLIACMVITPFSLDFEDKDYENQPPYVESK